MTNQSGVPAACLKLRSKDMFYKDPASANPEQEAIVARLYGTADTKVHWCQCTQTGRGPDDQPVNQTGCSNPGRRCFVGLNELA